jgi:hypothetical protein
MYMHPSTTIPFHTHNHPPKKEINNRHPQCQYPSNRKTQSPRFAPDPFQTLNFLSVEKKPAEEVTQITKGSSELKEQGNHKMEPI